MHLKGIGRWTADIYLLMALGRPDVWPAGDLALVVAAQQIKGLEARPSAEEFHDLGEAWRPWRSVAARLVVASLSFGGEVAAAIPDSESVPAPMPVPVSVSVSVSASVSVPDVRGSGSVRGSVTTSWLFLGGRAVGGSLQGPPQSRSG